MADWLEQLTHEGYTLLLGVLNAAEVQAIRAACTSALADAATDRAVLAGHGGQPYGARNLFRLWPGVLTLARHPALAAALRRVLGPRGGLVRGLYFDKPPGDSWALPWHRDLTVAVQAHGRQGRFLRPTTKAGVPHVEAPAELLATLLTARIHLDDVTDHNGPLRVLPGSHNPAHPVQADDRAAVTLTCAAGDVLLMRPLLLHASGHSTPGCAAHRRIVHLECAPPPELSDGYDWHDFLPLYQRTECDPCDAA